MPSANVQPFDLDALAERLYYAARDGSVIRQVSHEINLSVEDAYAIQARVVAMRVASGQDVVGIKMGFTSRQKMQQMGVHEMIFGELTDAMRVEEGGATPYVGYVHPRVEPELAFILRRPLCGKISLADAVAAVECVCPAIEIIDSRFQDFKFSIVDVIADNASASGFVVGTPRAPDFDIGNLGMVLSVSGRARQIGSSAAILGNPWRSVVAAAAFAERYGINLQAGSVVMAGAATEAVAVAAGARVLLEGQGLAPVQVTFAAQ